MFDGVQFLKEIPFSTLDNPFLIDYRSNRLLVGGFNEDRTTLVFQCLGDKGQLIKEERVAFEDKTVHPRDNYRLASSFLDNQWIVWVPAQLQLLVFDLELQLLNVRDLAIPEQILDIADIENILFREPDAVKRQKKCEAIIGQTIASLPMSLLIHDGKLGVVYQSASLVECGNLVKVRAKEPVKTKIRTEIIYFDKDQFQLEDLSIISGYYADGFYGDPNKLCGRVESHGAYHSAVWDTK